MADDFGTAIYTNCAPGQGLEGVGGMQFQSHSAGVDREALAMIRRNLLYEPPARLIRERQPIEAFPPSFAHAYDDVFATAAGVYIGREAGGTRHGNHLTHAIVADDARAYHSIRPAQMFGAPFWRTEPAATTRSDRLTASRRPGSFDATEVGQFVNGQPAGAALLTALLDALMAELKRSGDADARRVLFISDRPEPVLRWLAAATLLIPQHQALRIGFKVFTTDPGRSSLPVVAVHPDWTRSAAKVEDDRGYAVFDLIRNCWTPVPETPEARHWATLFCEADPHSVSQAVELAAASGLYGDAARDLAVAAVLGRPPAPASVRALVRWLRTGPPVLREAYGGTLIRTLTRLADRDQLLDIERITQDQFPGRRGEVQLALLRLELDDALLHRAPSGPATRWLASQRVILLAGIEAEASQLVTDRLRQARESAFDAVLRVAAQFGISVTLQAVRQAAAAFVVHWADHPEADYDPSAWPPEPPIYDMLREELAARTRDRRRAITVADQWWRRLWRWTPSQADITSPLHRALLSAAMAHSSPKARLKLAAPHLIRPGEPDETYYRELAGVLWARVAATTEELRALCDAAPAGTDLDPKLFAGLQKAAAGDPAGLPEIELCDDLARKELVQVNPATERLVSDHRWLQTLEASPDPPGLTPDADHRLAQVSPCLLAAHAEPLARCLLAIDDPGRVARLLDRLPVTVTETYKRKNPDQ